jgi:hypothetical protein
MVLASRRAGGVDHVRRPCCPGASGKLCREEKWRSLKGIEPLLASDLQSRCEGEPARPKQQKSPTAFAPWGFNFLPAFSSAGLKPSLGPRLRIDDLGAERDVRRPDREIAPPLESPSMLVQLLRKFGLTKVIVQQARAVVVAHDFSPPYESSGGFWMSRVAVHVVDRRCPRNKARALFAGGLPRALYLLLQVVDADLEIVGDCVVGVGARQFGQIANGALHS